MHRNWGWILLLLAIPGGGCHPPGPAAIPASASVDGQSGPLRIYFTDPDKPASDPHNPARILADYIARAETSLDVAVMELDNQVITEALVKAHERGVKVRLVTETNYLEERGVKALKAAGVPIVDDQRDGALMHHKFIVFDRRSVWMGSMNFTENCAYKNNNHGVFVDDPKIAANYATKFEWMFELRKFGGLPDRTARIPNPSVKLSSGAAVENYFSTHDRIADRIVERLATAKKSIHFLAFAFTHDDIAAAMLARAEAGVEVQGVFESRQVVGPHSEYEKLRAAGGTVAVYLDANKYTMHHKVIIIDRRFVICGSFNFSNNADRVNDENVLFIDDAEIAGRFEEEFQRVYTAAKTKAER